MSDFIVSFPGLGINDLHLNRVAFSIFGVNVYWYGLLIAIAAVLCIYLSTREAKQFGLHPDFVLDNFLVVVPSMIVGARLYYVAFSWDLYRDDLLSIFDTRKGGLAFYGGVIGGLLGIIILHKVKKKKVEPFLDFIAVYVPLGQAIGRIGNFINQEAFGTNTDLPWGMISNGTREYLAAHPELGQNPDLPVHPTFLYEFIGNMILFFILHRFRRKSKIPYGTVALYLAGYGLIRFFVEGIRTDALYVGSSDIRISRLVSALMVIASVIYLIALRKKKRQAVRVAEDDLFENTFEAMHETEQSPKASAASETEAVSESEVTPETEAVPEPEAAPKTEAAQKDEAGEEGEEGETDATDEKDETAESEKEDHSAPEKSGAKPEED